MIQIPYSYIKALFAITPKNDIRFYLCGVRIEPSTTHTVAVVCDGVRLVALRTQQGVAHKMEPFTIPYDVCKNIVSNKGSCIDVQFEQIDLNRWQVTCANGMKLEFTPVDGVYPDWRRLFKAQKNADDVGKAAQFNWQLLADMEQVARIAFGYRANMKGNVTHVCFSGREATLVRCPEHPEYAGLAMPLRDDALMKPIAPEWVK